jgi:FkbM family methyltransferase
MTFKDRIYRMITILFSKFYGRILFQKFFNALFFVSLDGLHYGKVHNIKTDGELWLLKRIRKELDPVDTKITVFDVGAHQGDYSGSVLTLFSDHHIDLHLFEPASKSFEFLQRKFSGSELVINHFGLGESHGKTILNIPVAETNCASIHHHTEGEQTEEIEIHSLDEYCKKNNIPYIDLLKLDVEGHEYACLQGGRDMLKNQRIRFIQFEFGECNIDSKIFFRDIFNYLDEMHYEVFRIVKNGLVPIKRYHQSLEIFITTNYFARIKGIGK